MNGTDKPIGYWLKHLHNLIDEQFDATLGDLGLDRRQWQILNVLSGATRSRGEMEQALAPFWPDGVPQLEAALDGADGLVTRGWVGYDADALTLTEQGRAAHGAAAERVGETRLLLLRGLTPEQYAETVRILSVMADNLEAALAGRAADGKQD
ncbi:MarR family transcriptional regulator [Micromonospora globispora]|uniref:MarR family transcriptional regulator n=1 Tax=Micromonospora globispora TaxID=1450148 RepID=UPI000F5DC909|nr:MarR family transcriptional regulator [Micromonospora globispora]RQW84059.1 MarR family transcriptional regulator [Micromonospora globispora]